MRPIRLLKGRYTFYTGVYWNLIQGGDQTPRDESLARARQDVWGGGHDDNKTNGPVASMPIGFPA